MVATRRVIIDTNNIVENAIIAEQSFNLQGKLIVEEAIAGIGWLYDVNTLSFTQPTPAVALTTLADIKAEANRRIENSMPMWMVAREVTGGTPIPPTIKTYAAAVRAASLVLEGTWPADYANDINWPTII